MFQQTEQVVRRKNVQGFVSGSNFDLVFCRNVTKQAAPGSSTPSPTEKGEGAGTPSPDGAQCSRPLRNGALTRHEQRG